MVSEKIAWSWKLVSKNSHAVRYGSENIFQIIIMGHGDKVPYIIFS